MSQKTQPATPRKAKKASTNKKRAIHRRLRGYPQEHFRNEFPRLERAYSHRSDLGQPSMAPFGDLEPSVQEPQERLDERIFGDEIGSRFGPGPYLSDAAMAPYPHYVEQEHVSGPPYFDAHHGARVGDTSNTNYGDTAQFEILDDRQVAGGSASYGTSMDFSPYPTDVGSVPSTSWSGPQTIAPSSSSAPQGTLENSVQFQNTNFGEHLNPGGWSIQLDFLVPFVPIDLAENMDGGGYGEYHGPSTWHDSNENFD